jgi:hypothetical protein
MIDPEGKIVTVDKHSESGFWVNIYEIEQQKLKITLNSLDGIDGEIFFGPWPGSDFYERTGDIPKKGRN